MMADVISLIIIITSVVTILGSGILMFYNEKLGLPINEWVGLIFISFMIAATEIIKQFNPGFDLSSRFLLISISIAIFILVVVNYWELFSEYSF